MEALLLNAPTSHPFARKKPLLSSHSSLSNGASVSIDNRNRIRLTRPSFLQATVSKQTVDVLPNSVTETSIAILGDILPASPLPPRKMVSPDSLQFPPGYLGAVPERSGSDGDEDSLNGMEYLTRILGSKVYDVAIESPLQLAPKLSERVGVNIWLKREDLQPVSEFRSRVSYSFSFLV